MHRESFFENLRQSLEKGRSKSPNLWNPDSEQETRDQVQVILDSSETLWEERYETIIETARKAGWNVARVVTLEDLIEYIECLVQEKQATKVVFTSQTAVRELGLDKVFGQSQIEFTEINDSSNISPADLRAKAIQADIGITGVEFAVAETGTCVLTAGSDTGRLVGLAPPVHVAIVTKGQVLDSLDDLFMIRKSQKIDGNFPTYSNLISGPSRSADIEYTLVTGVHGPGEVHMILVG